MLMVAPLCALERGIDSMRKFLPVYRTSRKTPALVAVLLCIGLVGCERADKVLYQNPTVPIWSGVAPGSESWQLDEVAGFNSITDVSTPTLTFFKPDATMDTGRAIVVLPGGGFTGLSVIKEGTAVAQWLADRGISGIVLKYRVRRDLEADSSSDSPDFDERAQALEAGRQLATQDAAQAMRFLREHATHYGLDPNKIGMMGFSAGAMTTMSVVVEGSPDTMPNLAASIYGAMPEVKIPAQLPPLFLVHAEDDPLVPASKSRTMVEKWSMAGVSAELNLFESGGHGFGAETTGAPTDAWLARFESWLIRQGWLPPGKSHTEPLLRAALVEGFKNPPTEAKPWVWWHWLNGNVSRDGIRADLDWMQRIGIGGLHNFDVNFAVPTVVEEPILYMSEQWKSLYQYAVDYATQHGLKFGIAASPGWSETGGPWVPPEDGMKKLVWSTLNVQGGIAFDDLLPEPPKVTGPYLDLTPPRELNPTPKKADPTLYRDVAVLAFPVQPASALSKPRVSVAGVEVSSAEYLSDGLFSTGVDFPPPAVDQPTIIELSYPREERVRSATLFLPDMADIYSGARVSATLEVQQDDSTWTSITDIALSTVPSTVSFPAVSGSKFRVLIAPVEQTRSNSNGAAPGYDDSLMKAMIAKFYANAKMPVNELRLSAESTIDQFELKAGFSVARDYLALEDSNPLLEAGVPLDKVLDLTGQLQADGRLLWQVPPGQWRVLRFGWSLLGKTNHPAIAEATGLEVDKLDGEAVRAYVERYLLNYEEAVGAGRVGVNGISALLTDSTEVGAFNWTPKLIEHFKRLRGYDPLPWLPTVTGSIIESRNASERFLYDFRQTLAELHATEHYGTLARVAQDRGLTVYGESLEGWRPSLGDDLGMRRFADVPMAAVWSYNQEEGPKPLYLADMRGAASVAHLYGQNLAAAESMTSTRHPWYHVPEDLRRVVDLEFVHGINRVVIHSSVHQPLDNNKPGLSLRHIGQFFNRHTAWSEMARPWMDYIAKSSYLLQQGRFVADVAYFYGEEGPLGAQTWDQYPNDVSSKYGYDFVNRDALLNVLDVKDGFLITPAGGRYRALYLGQHSRRMSFEVLQRIAYLVEAGATVIGEAPSGSLGLRDDDDAFEELARKLWSGKADTRVGAGRVLSGLRNVDHTMMHLGTVPDVSFEGLNDERAVQFVHRKLPGIDIYFVSNQTAETLSVTGEFRVSGRAPALWNAVTGEIEPLSFQAKGASTSVPLQFAPEESYFVVFATPTNRSSYVQTQARWRDVGEISGPWKVEFESGRGAPESIVLEQLVSLSELAEPAVRYFSGVSQYSQSFDLPAGYEPGDPLRLSLGEVGDLAEIRVNNIDVATLWQAPFTADIGGVVHAGENRLEIRVANRWVNRLIGDAQPDVEALSYTVTPMYSADAPLLPSGLIGPITLAVQKKF